MGDLELPCEPHPRQLHFNVQQGSLVYFWCQDSGGALAVSPHRASTRSSINSPFKGVFVIFTSINRLPFYTPKSEIIYHLLVRISYRKSAINPESITQAPPELQALLRQRAVSLILSPCARLNYCTRSSRSSVITYQNGHRHNLQTAA